MYIIYTYIYHRWHAYIHIHIHICMYVCMYVCLYVCMYIHTHIYIPKRLRRVWTLIAGTLVLKRQRIAVLHSRYRPALPCQNIHILTSQCGTILHIYLLCKATICYVCACELSYEMYVCVAIYIMPEIACDVCMYVLSYKMYVYVAIYMLSYKVS